MTKKEALKQFNEAWESSNPPAKDKPAKREAWVRYIDSLARFNVITNRQAETWDNPF